MARAVSATGGTVTNYALDGTNYTAHIFTSSGTFSNYTISAVEVLVVGAGGGGGETIGGGGGGGGVVFTNLSLVAPSNYTVIVGNGGAGGSGSGYPAGIKGQDSAFADVTAIGGGAGAGYDLAASGTGGSAGGNGGGGGARAGYTPGQGNDGGAEWGNNAGGGGGGAGQTGAAGIDTSGGKGGDGITNWITGVAAVYGGGGGGGTRDSSGPDPGEGGAGGGGKGGRNSVGTNGLANTGGGGGGGGYVSDLAGGNGGSGVVIVRYVAPELVNLSATNVLDTSAWLNGSLSSTGGVPMTVWVFWDTNDWTTNKTWPNGHEFDGAHLVTSLTWQASSLTPNAAYYYTYYASNALGEIWAQPSESFQAWGIPAADNGGGATNIGIKSARLRGTLLDGVGAYATIYWWTNAAPASNSASMGWITEGQSFSTLAAGLLDNTAYFYRCFVSNDFGASWSDVTNFSTPFFDGSYYVATNGPESGNGSSWAQAFTNLQTAIDAANPGDTIRLAAHTFTNSVPQSGCQYLWTNKPLTIIGGYAADGGSPGAFTNTPTILGRGAAAARILYIGGVTSGTLQRVTLAGGYGYKAYGMGLYVAASSNLTVGSCVISNNYTWSDNNPGGTKSAGIYFTGSDVRLTNCIVTLNTAYGSGKNYAICWGGGIYVASGRVSLDGCLVDRNSANGHPGDATGCRGGGIYLESGSLAISNSVVANNRAIGSEASRVTGYGGGCFVGGGTLTIGNSLLYGNMAVAQGYGWGVRVEGGSATLNNCTVASHAGDAISQTGGSVAMTNSILWGNADDIYGTVSLAYCDVKDGDSNGVNGCISADPLFQFGYYLDPASPCVNTGNMTAAAAGLSNRTTRVDGVPDDGVVDLGYHYAQGLDLTYADIYVAPDGDDLLNNGTNAASPFRTITKALTLATDGTRVHIAAGSYTNGSETFPLTLSGKSGVQLLGTNCVATIIDAYGSGQRVLTLSGASGGTRLEGLTFTGGRPNAGGMYIGSGSDVSIVSCVVSNNYLSPGSGASAYGGGISVADSSVRLTDTRVKGNSGYSSGWAAYSYGGGMYLQNSVVELVDSRVDNNGNGCYDFSSYGGGIHMASGSLLVSNSVIQGNATQGKSNQGYGGGISMASGILRLLNVLVQGNAAGALGYGYGIYVGGGSAALSFCTLAGHSGDAISQTGGSVAMTNSILWGNADDIYGTVSLAYCDIKDGDSNGVNGCISADPLFQSGYYLAPASPCVNTGNMTAAAAGLSSRTTRMDGTPDSGVVDLGYHYAQGLDMTYADIYVATNGSDTINNGTNAASPFRTITKALSLATDGTRVHIAAGSYTNGSETFPLTVSGMSGVQLMGTNSGATVVNASGSGQRVLTLSSASGGTRLEGLTFRGGNPGGGLYVSSGSDVSIVSCVVSNNYCSAANGSYGGGIYVQDSNARLTDTLVALNDVYASGWPADSYGGGIYQQNSVLTLANCLVERNSSSPAGNGYGGGLHMASGNLLVSNSVIRGNTAKNYGGGVSIAGGSLAMVNILVASNKSNSANSDGIYIGNGAAAFLNCTIATNFAVGVRYAAGTAAMTNGIVWGHTSADLAAWPAVGGILQNVAYTLLGGPPEMNGTNGCIVGDPLFTSAVSNDFTPTNKSPCVNSGLLLPWMLTALDLAGNPRVNRKAVDMGAYEAQLPPFGTMMFIR